MNLDRKYAVWAGVLLLLGFSGCFTKAFVDPLMAGENVLSNISGGGTRLAWGAVFQLIMAFSCSGIAVFFFPVLKKRNEAMALWAVVLRTFETVVMMAGVIGLFSLLALSTEFVRSGAAEAAHFQTLGSLIRATYEWSGAVLVTLCWSLAALVYHVLFYQSRIIPRWLSLWGILGVPFAIAAGILTMFGTIGASSTASTLLVLPLGLQEIPLALWLITKGYNPQAMDALSARKAEAL